MLTKSYLAVMLLSAHGAFRGWCYPKEAVLLEAWGIPFDELHAPQSDTRSMDEATGTELTRPQLLAQA